MYYFKSIIFFCNLALFWNGIAQINCKSQQYFWPNIIPYQHPTPYLIENPLVNYLVYKSEPSTQSVRLYNELPIIVPENCQNNITSTAINRNRKIDAKPTHPSEKQNETTTTGNLEPPFTDDGNRQINDESENILSNQNTNSANLIPNYYYYIKTPYYFNENSGDNSKQEINGYSVFRDEDVIREINQRAMNNNKNNRAKEEFPLMENGGVKLKQIEQKLANNKNDEDVAFYEGVTPSQTDSQ